MLFDCGFKDPVIGKNQMAARGNVEAFFDMDPTVGKAIPFFDQGQRVQHHSGSDDALQVIVKDSRRNKVEDELPAPDSDCVTGVVATLIAGHDVELIGDDVDDLALALVTPLGPYDREVLLLFHSQESTSESGVGFYRTSV